MHISKAPVLALLLSQLYSLAFALPTTQTSASSSQPFGHCSTLRKPGSSIYVKISCHNPGNPLSPGSAGKVLNKAASSIASLFRSNFHSKIADSIWSEGDASLGGQSVVGLRIGAGGITTDGTSKNAMTNGQIGAAIEALQEWYQSPPYQPALFSIGDDQLGPLSCGSFLSGAAYPNGWLECWNQSDVYCESAQCAAWLQA